MGGFGNEFWLGGGEMQQVIGLLLVGVVVDKCKYWGYGMDVWVKK